MTGSTLQNVTMRKMRMLVGMEMMETPIRALANCSRIGSWGRSSRAPGGDSLAVVAVDAAAAAVTGDDDDDGVDGGGSCCTSQ